MYLVLYFCLRTGVIEDLSRNTLSTKAIKCVEQCKKMIKLIDEDANNPEVCEAMIELKQLKEVVEDCIAEHQQLNNYLRQNIQLGQLQPSKISRNGAYAMFEHLDDKYNMDIEVIDGRRISYPC